MRSGLTARTSVHAIREINRGSFPPLKYVLRMGTFYRWRPIPNGGLWHWIVTITKTRISSPLQKLAEAQALLCPSPYISVVSGLRLIACQVFSDSRKRLDCLCEPPKHKSVVLYQNRCQIHGSFSTFVCLEIRLVRLSARRVFITFAVTWVQLLE